MDKVKQGILLIGVLLSVFASLGGVAAGADPENLSGADFRRLRQQAFQGDAQAQFQLGVVYEEGRAGVKPDIASALSWYEEAARNGLKVARQRIDAMSSEPL